MKVGLSKYSLSDLYLHHIEWLPEIEGSFCKVVRLSGEMCSQVAKRKNERKMNRIPNPASGEMNARFDFEPCV